MLVFNYLFSLYFYFDDSETGLSVVASEEQDRQICLGIDECIDSCANRNRSACNAIFSRFSTHFLLTNLVVIPLVTVTLYAAVLMLLLTPLPAVQFVMAEVVRFLLKVLNDFVRWVEQLPNASLDGIWLYRLEVLGIYIFLLLFLYYSKTRRFRNLVICFSCLLCLGIYHTVMRWYDRPARALYFTMFVVVRRFIVLLRMGLLG